MIDERIIAGVWLNEYPLSNEIWNFHYIDDDFFLQRGRQVDKCRLIGYTRNLGEVFGEDPAVFACTVVIDDSVDADLLYARVLTLLKPRKEG